MDFELAFRIAHRALVLGREGADLRNATTEIVAMSAAQLPDIDRAKIVDLVEAAPAEIVSILTDLFESSPPPADINGLWFGLVELSTDPDDAEDGDGTDEPDDAIEGLSSAFSNPASMMIPYVGGSPKFDGDQQSEWMCTLTWKPDEGVLPLGVIEALNYERQEEGEEDDDDDSGDLAWHVDTCLIEPLMILCIYAALRQIDPKLILRTHARVAIASGFDAGDLRPLGVITPSGLDVSSVPPPKPFGVDDDTEIDQDDDASV